MPVRVRLYACACVHLRVRMRVCRVIYVCLTLFDYVLCLSL